MAELEKLADDLLAQPWSPVHIGDSPFLLKATFGEVTYRLMLSDLNSVWWEEVNSDELKQRAQELNKRLRAPVSAFCRHLSGLLEPFLQTEGTKLPPGFTSEQTCNQLTVSLRSELSGVPFYWAFRCTEAPLSMVSRHMICPLLNMMQALHRQTWDLMLLLQRKDAEILDYKESGAMLSRDRLSTDIFNAEEFKERFLTELGLQDWLEDDHFTAGVTVWYHKQGLVQPDGTEQKKSLSEAIDVHSGRMFNPELQRLYRTIIAVKANRKRRHSSEKDDGGDPQPGLAEAQAEAASETKAEEVTAAAAEGPEVKKQVPRKRLPPAALSNSNRNTLKQKKKKKGIFG
ncbi:non-homologous end-joining factor 1 isoform X1 [Hemitrygon akajei]|uniref:non-homologous end-joining factor 1 isoform X1 n=1 Tax=Hemitrygon akajei TaxID=2704970 RepID=UPI003BF9666B